MREIYYHYLVTGDIIHRLNVRLLAGQILRVNLN